MSSQQALRLAIEPLRTLAFGSISGTYAGIGIALMFPSRKLLIQNYTNAQLTFSDDGVNDKFVLASGVQLLLDEALNHQGDYTAVGTRFYVKGTAASGAVYVSTWYGAS